RLQPHSEPRMDDDAQHSPQCGGSFEARLFHPRRLTYPIRCYTPHFARSFTAANNVEMNKGITDFPARLASIAGETEMLLKQLLGVAPLDGEVFGPSRLIDPLQLAATTGSKRVHP